MLMAVMWVLGTKDHQGEESTGLGRPWAGAGMTKPWKLLLAHVNPISISPRTADCRLLLAARCSLPLPPSTINCQQPSCRLPAAPDELPTRPQPVPPTLVLLTMSASNIRVFVQWKDSTVFAGEDIECTITFKNVALPEGRNGTPATRHNGFATGGDRQRKLPVPPVHSSTRPSVSRKSSFTSQLPPAHTRGHRPALSLHTPSTPGGHQSPATPSAAQANSSTGGQKHGRSVSIISLGTEAATEASHERGISIRRPARGHGRSASLQVVPGRPNSYPSTTTADTTTATAIFL